jgi:hypothetical protein
MPKSPKPKERPHPHSSRLTPPPGLRRPRNGIISGDALKTDDLSDPSGGGKVKNPYITEAEKMSRESEP